MKREEEFFSRTIAWIQQVVRWGTTPHDAALFDACRDAAPQLIIGPDACNEPGGRALARLTARVLVRAFPGSVIFAADTAFGTELENLAVEPLGYRLHGTTPVGAIVIGTPTTIPDIPAFYVGFEGPVARLAASPCFTSSLAYGPSALLAGAFGVAEATKVFLRQFLPTHGGRWTAWDLTPTPSLAVRAGLAGESFVLPDSPVDLGKVLVVSAGAVTHAALAALLETPGVTGRLTVCDHERLEVSNGNRYLLLSAKAALAGMLKVDQLAAFTGRPLSIVAMSEDYAAGHALADLVLIGADRITARLDVQRDKHACIVNGATEHDFVRVSLHERNRGACLGCINPASDPETAGFAPTISFVSASTGAFVAGTAIEAGAGFREPGSVLDIRTLQPARIGNMVRARYGRSASCVLGHEPT
jgi:molybdopterin/thiamine biosynthesis adenylyltransferase